MQSRVQTCIQRQSHPCAEWTVAKLWGGNLLLKACNAPGPLLQLGEADQSFVQGSQQKVLVLGHSSLQAGSTQHCQNRDLCWVPEAAPACAHCCCKCIYGRCRMAHHMQVSAWLMFKLRLHATLLLQTAC